MPPPSLCSRALSACFRRQAAGIVTSLARASRKASRSPRTVSGRSCISGSAAGSRTRPRRRRCSRVATVHGVDQPVASRLEHEPRRESGLRRARRTGPPNLTVAQLELNLPRRTDSLESARRVGVEPTMPLARHRRLSVARLRPLSHRSVQEGTLFIAQIGGVRNVDLDVRQGPAAPLPNESHALPTNRVVWSTTCLAAPSWPQESASCRKPASDAGLESARRGT